MPDICVTINITHIIILPRIGTFMYIFLLSMIFFKFSQHLHFIGKAPKAQGSLVTYLRSQTLLTGLCVTNHKPAEASGAKW